MVEQDYIMQLIRDMVRAMLKLIFKIETDSPSSELLENAEARQTLDELIDMIDQGNINEAENRIYDITENTDRINLEIALLFYAHLNEKSNQFLEEHEFSREEVKSGLREASRRYGFSDFVDLYLQ